MTKTHCMDDYSVDSSLPSQKGQMSILWGDRGKRVKLYFATKVMNRTVAH